MKNTYVCPSCKEEFDWDDSLDQTMIRCPECETEMVAPAPMLEKDAVVGDYRIIGRIGIGGMGEVYLAEQKSMKRTVALKILQEDLVQDKAYLDRFYREVRTLAQIEHPNVVSAIEAGADGHVYYFSMTFVEGKDIKRMLDEGHIFKETEAVKIALEVAYALKFVWEKHGILHRDIKPANIMLTPENEVKLMDLGISKKMFDEDVELTAAGMMIGSPQYVCPEQAKALKDVDFRADMYSLGATLYHMLAGSPPYPGNNAMAVIAKHLDEPIPDPRKAWPEISETTANLIAVMMAKKKEDRFGSWDECIDAMKDILEDVAETPGDKIRTAIMKAAAIPKIEKVAARKSVIFNRPWKIIAVAVLFIIFVFGMILTIKKGNRDSRRDRAMNLYNEAVKFIGSNPEPSNFRKALAMLENVQGAGDPHYSAEAKREMEKILEKGQQSKNKKQQDQKGNALDDLKEKAYEFEKNGDYEKAVSLWINYRKNGPYAKDFESEIQKAVDYLNRKKKLKEEGLE
ncbi:MAG: serine/threonine-protein kinase [Lentisphaerae bacterium]|nr:serine/threonine-protein kinase [Lentisphaerota bacterium]